MAKYVVETIQVVTRKYYCSVENPEYIHDSLVFNELHHFSEQFLSEDVISTTKVDKFPTAKREIVNAATYKWDEEARAWVEKVRWDLAKD